MTVVFGVECLIANWGWWLITVAAGRGLVVKVQVLGAAIFRSAVNGLAILCAATVHCEHFFAIGITVVVLVTQVVLIMVCAEMMATNPNSLGIVLLATCIGCVI